MGARRRPLLVDILARLGGILAASFQLLGGLFKPVAPPAPTPNRFLRFAPAATV